MDLIIELERNDDFSINDWGSAQYCGAKAFFDLLDKYRKDSSLDDLLAEFGIVVGYDHKLPFEQVKMEIRTSFDFDDPTIQDIRNAETIEDIFEALKDASWDLWSAASFVAQHCFLNLTVTGVPTAHSVGPVGNQMVQSENYLTGLYCALLVEFEYVTDSSCFANFDT